MRDMGLKPWIMREDYSKNSCSSPIDLFYLGNSQTVQGVTQLFKKQDGEITPLLLPRE